jgi:flagellar capping protein FliD
VALQRDGTMAVGQDALNTALSKNPGAVNTLLTDPVQGAGARIDRSVRNLRGSQGAIYNAEEALRQKTQDTQKQAQQLQDDLQRSQDYYTQKYSDLNSTINQASATSAMVVQRLGATPQAGG